MQTPVYTIASNAGVEGAVVVGKLLESSDPDLGYDAAKGRSKKLCCVFQKVCSFCLAPNINVNMFTVHVNR